MDNIRDYHKSDKPVIWITGASSGIGREIALQLAEQDNLVIASARNQDALDKLAAENPNIVPLAMDITDHDGMYSVIRKLAKISRYLDTIILNAGNCEYLDFPRPDWCMVQRVMAVNFQGTVNCIELALPFLRRSQTRSHIVGIVSQVTNAPFPRAEAYGASKAALAYFLASLRIDLMPEKIDVSIINPGFVDTPLTQKNDFDMPFLMSAHKAAARIVKQINRRCRDYSFPKRLSAMLFLSKLFPRLWQKIVVSTGT